MYWVCAGLAVALLLSACEPEGRVLPMGMEHQQVLEEETGFASDLRWDGILVDHAGQEGTGSVYEANHYGKWSLKLEDQILACNIVCGQGWYLNQVWAWVGDWEARPLHENGDAKLGAFPYYHKLPTMKLGYSIDFPFAASLYQMELAFMLKLELVELDFLGSPFHPTEVWAEGDEGAGTAGAKVVSLGKVKRDTALAMLSR